MTINRSDLAGLAQMAQALNITEDTDPVAWEMLRKRFMTELDESLRETVAAATPSYEDVFDVSPKGFAREDFAALLEAAGYDSGARGFAQWGAQDWERLSLDQRQQKLDAIRSLIQQNSPVAPVQGPSSWMQTQQGPQRFNDMVGFDVNGDGGLNVLSCPSGQNHGEAYQNVTREGKRFYKCRNPQCSRPGQAGKVTTWDDGNYAKRQEEFRTGQPAQAGPWRGRG